MLDIPAIPGYSDRADRASATFVVEEPPSPEEGDLSRDDAALEELVRAAGAGGAVVPVDRARDLADLIGERTRPRTEVLRIEQWALSWPILVLFALIATLEWALRKRYDLV